MMLGSPVNAPTLKACEKSLLSILNLIVSESLINIAFRMDHTFIPFNSLFNEK